MSQINDRVIVCEALACYLYDPVSRTWNREAERPRATLYSAHSEVYGIMNVLKTFLRA